MKNNEIVEKADLILEKVGLEKDQKSEDQSIGYIEYLINNKKEYKWILRREKVSTSKSIRDINGCVINTAVGNINSVYQRNETIYRDSPIGKSIFEGVGEQEIKTRTGEKYKMLVDLLSTYSTKDNGDVVNGKIIFRADSQEFKFSSLLKDLKDLKDLIEKNNKIKKELSEYNDDQYEAKQLQKQLDKNDEDISALKKKVRQYISQEVALRDQPILDKYQEDVKRSKILDGTLIINGGPGTGKTTSLIQRINYLTSPTLQEEIGKFTPEVANLLLNQKSGWVFYSPSELLRDYLSNAMIAEGLEADKDRVLTWKTHRAKLLRQTGLINLEKRKPFIIKKRKDDDFYFKQNSKVYKDLNDLFMRYILDKQSAKIEKIHDLNIFNKFNKSLGNSVADNYRLELKKLAIQMQDSSIQALKYRKIDTWVPFFISFKEEFSERIKEINLKLLEEIKNEASLLQIKLVRNEAIYSWFEEVIKNEIISNQQEDETDDDYEEETDDEDSDNESTQKLINRKLTNLIRNISLYYIDSSNTKISAINKELIGKIENLLNRDKLISLGIRLYFKKYFERAAKGLESNLFSEIPTSYKIFRRTILKGESSCLTGKGVLMCDDILKNKNIYLYDEEADYILAIIFNLCKVLYKNRKTYFNNSNHPYVTTFREHMKGVVAIDEATDFSLWELIAMTSLSHPLFNSVTLSGDLMQRLSNNGISSWKEYINIVKNTEIRDLKIAYRQTAKLLNVASEIYSWNISEKAEFKAYNTEDPLDPDPLVCISDDDEEKIDWLVNRIMEIQKVYGSSFPTVAVFVKDDSEVYKTTKLLEESVQLEEAGIEVKACSQGQILGNKQDVRVFNIEYIKGLEFGAVFFHNIDDIKNAQEELINKYIYVGLSRANLFLGVTMSDYFGNGLEYLQPLFKEGSWKEWDVKVV